MESALCLSYGVWGRGELTDLSSLRMTSSTFCLICDRIVSGTCFHILPSLNRIRLRSSTAAS